MHRVGKNAGFTIVELLIVVVVIAILAAIAFVSYNGISNQARSAAIQAETNQVIKKLSLYTTESGGVAPEKLSDIGITDSNSTTFQYIYNNTSNPATYCVTTTNGSMSYFASSSQPSPRAGACLGHAANGEQAFVNLAHNPLATSFGESGNGRWSNTRFLGYSGYELLTGLSGAPNGITTAVRMSVTSASSNNLALGFHISGNTDQEPTSQVGTRIPVEAGVSYSFSVYVRWTGTPGQVAAIVVRFSDDSGTWLGSTRHHPTPTLNSGVWQRVSGVTTAPAGATGVTVTLRRANNVGATYVVGDTLDATGLMIVKGSSTPNFAHGGSPGWTWYGAPNNSISSGPAL